jgi:hypothetical protein
MKSRWEEDMLQKLSILSAALRKYFRTSALTAAGSALLLAGGPAAAEQPPDEMFAPTKAITLPSPQNITNFDNSFVDPVIGQYFLADRTNKAVDVVDTDTDTARNTLATQLKATPPFAGFTGSNNTSGPNGVITVGHKEVWAGDGDSTIKVISLVTGATIRVINTGGKNRADELCLDPRDKLVMMANPAETPFPFVTLISTETYSVLKTIVMDGTAGTPKATNGIKHCQWNPRTGKFYLDIPEVNGPGDDSAPGAVLVISPDVVIPGTALIENTFNLPIDKCAGPMGMAIGPENQILLGCQATTSSVIINARSGSIIATLDNEGGSDEVWFNEGDSQYFLAESAPSFSSNQLLGVIDAWSHQEDKSVVTGIKSTATTPRGGNHSVAADPVLNQVYVPIASNSGSTICGTLGGSNTVGCIAVFTATGDDKARPPQ